MSFFAPKDQSLNPIVNLVGSICASLGLLLTLTTFAQVSKINRTQTPTLVETCDGKSHAVTPIGHYERTPDSVKEFVASKLFGLFEWSGYVPPQSFQEIRNPQFDIGVKVGDRYVTTAAFNTASALSQNHKFKTGFLKGLAEITPQGLFRSTKQPEQRPYSTLTIQKLLPPREIKLGVWEEDVIADLKVYKSKNQIDYVIPVNKTITVTSVDNPVPPPWADEAQKINYEERVPGMEITYMQDLSLSAPSQAPQP